MNAKRSLVLVMMFTSMLACSSSTSGGAGTGGGDAAGGSCTESDGANIAWCTTYASNAAAWCAALAGCTTLGEASCSSAVTMVPSCPTASVVGTCSFQETSSPGQSGVPLDNNVVEVTYSPLSCATAKSTCDEDEATFTGNGC
jgi:hypothetical protein